MPYFERCNTSNSSFSLREIRRNDFRLSARSANFHLVPSRIVAELSKILLKCCIQAIQQFSSASRSAIVFRSSSTMSNSIDQLYEVLSRRTPSTQVHYQQCRTPSTAAICRLRFQVQQCRTPSTRPNGASVQQCRTPSTATILSTMSNSIDCPSSPVLCSVLR